MNVQKYLTRIKFNGRLAADIDTLKRLHRQHLFNVPFENLDVHFKRPFNLKHANVYRKIVTRGRGGFCYEINSLFNELLKVAGFTTRIISARVITGAGEPGPEYDHMAIHIEDKKSYIADVGFGDLFVVPLEIRSGVQYDGRNYFQIQDDGSVFSLLMSDDGKDFQKKYTFKLTETPISLFEGPCRDKQVDPDSHFVKNTICTKPTDSGRITIYNNTFTETVSGRKTQEVIEDDEHLVGILKERFGITIH